MFENNRNKPLMENNNVTVRRENGKYAVGFFGAMPYYYNVVCDNKRIDYKLCKSGHIRIIYSVLLALTLVATDIFMIYGAANGSLTNIAGGIIVFSFLALIGILWACVPLFYKRAINKFINSI